MLQRSQSLFLLIAFVFSLMLLTGPLAIIPAEGGEIVLKHSGVFDNDGNDLGVATWPLTIFFVLVTALAFFNIFFYRHRVRQMRICVYMIILNVGMVGIIFYYIRYAMNQFDGIQNILQWRIVIPPIVAILLYLAYRRIQRDELLVKSYDRIRK